MLSSSRLIGSLIHFSLRLETSMSSPENGLNDNLGMFHRNSIFNVWAQHVLESHRFRIYSDDFWFLPIWSSDADAECCAKFK